MAFITNEKGGRNKLGDRLSALVKYAERLDMLVGYFFFSGVKVMYDALKARPDLKVRTRKTLVSENYAVVWQQKILGNTILVHIFANTAMQMPQKNLH